MHTPESLSTKTNDELDEIMALAQGFIEGDTPHRGVKTWIKKSKGVDADEWYLKYSPTTNKEQAWDLTVKYLDDVSIEDLCRVAGRKNPLEAVTLAAIVIIQGEKK